MRPQFPELHAAPEVSAPLEAPERPEPPARVGAEALEAAYRPKTRACVTHCVESVPEVCQ